ncbi:hypothetical protein SMC1_07865 [Candidatus Cryosericum septentrionale]|uniref:Uncharacterized protein n=1 Tax=Candidatus Cryosericum septentrionale TaxID=2290913 RepID=A0A398DPT4_9BACT|nr:hypothetical protein SMC1_07865 [Candidatus Cryosericum septentrionale]
MQLQGCVCYGGREWNRENCACSP